jgi:hypothetical protein
MTADEQFENPPITAEESARAIVVKATKEELEAREKELREALTRIRDGAELCECDHTTKDCCALQHPVDAFCAFCIADRALSGEPETKEG